MSDWQDPALAARARDAMRKQMVKVLDNERPPYRYATVDSIDPDLRTAWVVYPEDPTPVPVKIGGIVPASSGVVVRVSGRRGDKYISDVMGAAVTSSTPAGDLDAPASFVLDGGIGSVTAHWLAIDGVQKYRVTLADDAGFTVNARTYDTINTAFTENALNPGSTVWGKVQGLTNSNTVGAASSSDSATVADFPVDFSDGTAPSASPTPTCTGGLGYVLAEWLPVSNNDAVTYEVHISLTSGFSTSPSTYLGETTESTFFFIRHMPNGDPLTLGVNLFVRIVAKDPDGSATQGAQGFAAPQLVQTGDVGTIAGDQISDGNLPPDPVAAPVLTPGIGFLLAKWAHVVNADPVMYEVHISTVTGFTPTSATLIGETPSNTFFIRTVGSGLGGGALAYGTSYFVKFRPKDADGSANPSPQATSATIQANTADIAAGAITAASAIIADAAIGTAKIQTAAITTALIADAQISTAKIQNLAVGTAQIADAAIATAKIGNLQVTDAKIGDLNVNKLLAGTISAKEIILSNSVLSILRSDNYSAGSTGWRIRGNGDAEFNNVTVRGTLVTGSMTIDSSGVRFASASGTVSYAITWGYAGDFGGVPSIFADGSGLVISDNNVYLGRSIESQTYVEGNLHVAVAIDVGGTSVSLSGHTHSYVSSGDSPSFSALSATSLSIGGGNMTVSSGGAVSAVSIITNTIVFGGKSVSQGATNTGGAGFRALVVAN